MDLDFEKTTSVQDELIRNRLGKRLQREVDEDEELHHLGVLDHPVKEKEEVGENPTMEHCDDDDDIISHVTLLEVPERKRLAAVDQPNVVIQSNNLEEMEMETLKIQNRNLSQTIRTLREQEGIMQGKIVQLERHQRKNENAVNIVNRYWDQLNDEVAIAMRRLDDETVTGGLEAQPTTSSSVSLVSKLNGAENLTDRVKWSTSAIAKIIKAMECLHQQRKQSIMDALNIAGEKVPDDVRQTLTELEKENGKLQELINTAHDRYHNSSLETKELQANLSTSESIRDDLKKQFSGLEWQTLKLTTKYNKVVDYVENLKDNHSKLYDKHPNSTMKDNDEVGHVQIKLERGNFPSESVDSSNLRHDLQEWELTSNNRLVEIENLQRRQREALKEIEKLRMDINNLPEEIVMETTWCKSLRSKYSVIHNQNLELKELLEAKNKAVATLTSDCNTTIENMKGEEKKQHEYFRTQLQEKERDILQTSKMLQDTEAEYQQLVASTEFPAEISQEMRNLLTSLQTQNQQLRNVVRRYVQKYTDLKNESTNRLLSSVDLDDSNSNTNLPLVAPPRCTAALREDNLPSSSKSESRASASCSGQRRILVAKRTISQPKSQDDVIKELTSQLKKFSNETKELRFLLDMYKSADFEIQEKVQLMVSERKARVELEETKKALGHTEKELRQRAYRKALVEDLTKRTKPLEEQVSTLQKQITVQRRGDDALINEIMVICEAIEETQENTAQSIQRLREKDDVNFKLIAENIRSSKQVTVIGLQKESLQKLCESLGTKLEAKKDVESSLNDQVTRMSTIINQQNDNVTNYMQATEQRKKGTVESTQTLNELRLKLSHGNSQVEDLKKNVLEKTDALEVEGSRAARLQEELTEWRQKAEHSRAMDPVLKEMIRRSNEAITCPACKVNKKDAVLTKCFHVFCYTCLKTRYETRQRKCPKCNAAFGANEYRHIDL